MDDAVSEALWIAFAFTAGLIVKQVGLPPLVGYLAAGFALTGLAHISPLVVTHTETLEHIAHTGVLLLLFTVGLKLRIRSLFSAEVLGGSLVHFVVTVALFSPVLGMALALDWPEAIMLAITLSFSSTVLAAKVLENRRELKAFHGRVAIGILIMQDLIAMAVLSGATESTISPWAPVVLALPILRPLLYWLLDLSGHDELMVLLGLLLALVAGGAGFEFLGLSSELGALLFGALLSGHRRASELGKSLWSLKEAFLVGFFLQIGIGGLPGEQALWFAIMVTALLPLKSLLLFGVMLLFRLRARSSFLTTLSLSNYSEFGLILASIALPQWTMPLALAVAFSFMLSAPFSRAAHRLYNVYGHHMLKFERTQRHPDEQPISLGETRVLIMGMGRAGTSAYDRLIREEPAVMGLDSDPGTVARHRQDQRQVVYGDAEDSGFWQTLHMPSVEAVILAMSDVEAKLTAARQLRARGFGGFIVSHSLFEDEAEQVRLAGADEAYLTMSEAGFALANHVLDACEDNRTHS